MVAAVALPILLFVTVLLVRLEMNERGALDRRTERDAQALANSVSRQFQDMYTTLRLLATSPELEEEDLRPFHNRTQGALRSGSTYVIVVRADGQQLLNTRVSFGTPLGRISERTSLDAALKSGQIALSNVFFGSTSGQWVFNVILPLGSGQKSGAAALIMTQDANNLTSLITTEGLPRGWSAGLIDGAGRIVLSSSAAGDFAGGNLLEDVNAQMTQSSGVLQSPGLLRGSVLAYARMPGWDWKAVVWGPLAPAQATLMTTWRALALGGMVLIAGAFSAAFLLSRRIRRSIRRMADMAERLGRGEIVSPADTAIDETDQVARALSEASFDRSQAEDQMRLIQRELVHRTKNMLTLVQAMMRQTAKRSETIADYQTAVSSRLGGLARSIDLLTAEDWSGVSMRKLVASHLDTFIGAESRVAIEGEDFSVKPEAVQNLGMVLHELATNAVKYGALSVPAGKVAISWDEKPGDGGEAQITLRWVETGGPPPAKSERRGFGSTVIDQHAQAAFRAVVDIAYAPGGLLWTMSAPAATLRQAHPA